MTNTESLASRIANHANELLAERVRHFMNDERYDFVEWETALEFYNWLRSITFYVSTDGRAVVGEGSLAFTWTFTPVEIGDQACGPFQAELDELQRATGVEPEWSEPAPAWHVLRLF